MPMLIGRAADLGISGYESQHELDENKALFERMEALRLEAGRRMGLGDVTSSVTPKIGLIAAPKAGGHITARYFMPWATHPTMAVTGSQCLAACALAPGTVAEGLARKAETSPTVMSIEHPMGAMEVTVNYALDDQGLQFKSAGVVRTARLIARAEVMVPATIMSATQ
ncbi:MAG: PrpF domain-containing protein [Geminicoccaceae bacterium]